jgi:hypothetical protein
MFTLDLSHRFVVRLQLKLHPLGGRPQSLVALATFVDGEL